MRLRVSLDASDSFMFYMCLISHIAWVCRSNVIPDSMHCAMRTIEKMLVVLVQEGLDNKLKLASIKERENYMDGVNAMLKVIYGDSYSGCISYKKCTGELGDPHFATSEKARLLLGKCVQRILLLNALYPYSLLSNISKLNWFNRAKIERGCDKGWRNLCLERIHEEQ